MVPSQHEIVPRAARAARRAELLVKEKAFTRARDALAAELRAMPWMKMDTYFTTGRGLEVMNSSYAILDLVPRGRDEADLDEPMGWVRRHDEYAR